MPLKTLLGTHEGRVALVTGAGQGIGQAIALALAERGAQVIATDLTPPDETTRKIGSSAYAIQLDVTQEEQWRSAAAKTQDVGEVDIVRLVSLWPVQQPGVSPRLGGPLFLYFWWHNRV